MVTRFLGLDRYVALLAIGFSLILLAACAKKVPPVSGGSGIASVDEGSSNNRGFPSDDSMSGGGMDDTDDVTAMNRDRFTPPTSEGDRSMEASLGDRGNEAAAARAVFAENIYFDFDKADIRNDAKSTLSENARWLALNPDVKIQIEGHGDERGTNEYNLALGERRARSVLRYLINLGINESRFSFISYGEEKGVCSDQNETCYQKNRRAYFQVKE